MTETRSRTVFTEPEVRQAVIQSLRQAAEEAGSVTNDNQHDILARGFEIINTYTFLVDLPEPKRVRVKKEVVIDGRTHTIDTDEYIHRKEVKYSWFFQKGHAWNAYTRVADFSELPVRNPFRHRADRNRFIRACAKLFPNIDAYKAGETLTNFRKAIENIYCNLGEKGLRPQQVCFYQHSMLGGTGKSNFLSILEAFCGRHGLPCGHVNPTNQRWIGNDYSRLSVGLVDEFFCPRGGSEADDKVRTINNIIDNVEYQVEYKGQDSYFLRSKVTLFINSNRLPFDTNIRRYGIAAYNEVPYANIKQETLDRYFQSRSMDEWVDIMTEAFESCPFGEVFKDRCCRNSESLNNLIYTAKYVVDKAPEIQSDRRFIDISCCTVREFAVLYTKLCSPSKETPEAVRTWSSRLKQDILRACAQGIIRPAKRTSGVIENCRFDLHAIASLPVPEDITDTSLDGIDDMWERTQAAIASFLSAEDTTPPEDTRKRIDRSNDYEYTDEDVKRTAMLPDDDGYGVSLKVKDSTQFIVAAVPRKEYLQELIADKSRKLQRLKKDFLPAMFVYESDKIPYIDSDSTLSDDEKKVRKIDEQVDMAEEALSGPDGGSIYSVTYSGSKSVHILVRIAPKDRLFLAAEERLPGGEPVFKHVWRAVAKRLFGERAAYCDEACGNYPRLTRRPGGTRAGGIRQQCWHMNREAEGIDISDIIAETKELLKEAERERELSEARRASRPACTDWGDTPLMEQFRRIAVKSGTAASLGALEMLETGVVPQGELPMMAIGYLSAVVNYIDSKFMPLYDELYDLCQDQHPSNITKSRESYLEKRQPVKEVMKS